MKKKECWLCGSQENLRPVQVRESGSLNESDGDKDSDAGRGQLWECDQHEPRDAFIEVAS